MKRGRGKWVLAGLAVVFVLLARVLIERARGTGGPPQFVAMTDGTKFRFGGATWGTNHVPPFFAERVEAHLPKSLADLAQKKFGKRLGLVPTSQSDTPMLQVWMNQIASPPGTLFATVPLRAFLADENGVEAGITYSYVNGYHPWPSADFPIVPRRSRMLEVNFYTNNYRTLPVLPKIGSVRFRNPLYGKYPQWQPESLPVTRMAGGVQLTLTDCRAGDRAENKFATSFSLQLAQPGDTNEHWQIQRLELRDATGNCASTENVLLFDGGRECSVPALFWPDEHALRLKVWLRRTAGFSSNELTTVTNLPLPVANATNGVTFTNQVGGHTILIRNFVEINKKGGGIQVFDGPIPFPRAISMVLNDPLGDFFAQIENVETESGEPLREHQERWTANGREWRYNSFPSNTQFLRVSVSVQKMRTVEFLVKPPNAK